VVLIGECGTGKSHLATGLCLAACRQKRRVRFTTAAALVNELVEAKQKNQVPISRRIVAISVIFMLGSPFSASSFIR
jgi:DNA replication protein DnaC